MWPPAPELKTFEKHLASSGKSPAYVHGRKNFKSPRREVGRGLF